MARKISATQPTQLTQLTQLTQPTQLTQLTQPTAEHLLEQYRLLNRAERKSLIKGIEDSILAAVRDSADGEIDMELIGTLKEGLRLITAPGAEIDDDLEAVCRVVTFENVLAELQASLSERAVTIYQAGTATSNPQLEARLRGAVAATERTAVSSDGARRAGSGEAKGSVRDAVPAFLATKSAGEWSTITEAGKWITSHGAEFGYTPDYVISGGAILARNGDNQRAREWRYENNIEFAKVDTGKPAPVWCVRRTV